MGYDRRRGTKILQRIDASPWRDANLFWLRPEINTKNTKTP
jgi:hypothetical protein